MNDGNKHAAALASARKALSDGQAPRFVDTARLAAMAGVDAQAAVPVRVALVREGALRPAGEGAYANGLAVPRVHQNEMVAHYGLGTYATMHTVLGEHGVANNPSRTVYAVRARSPENADSPDVLLRSRLGDYRLLTMPREVMEAGEREDRLEDGGRYLRATPERAFLDWIWFSARKGLSDPPLDLDLSELDKDRIDRLARAMGVEGALAAWMARHELALADEAVEGSYSPGLGF